MNSSQVATIADLRQFVLSLTQTAGVQSALSLEEYLRALWRLIEAHRDAPVSFSLFGRLFQEAFTSQVPLFDEEWLAHKGPPEQLQMDPALVLDDFGFVRDMLLYQIADLNRFEQAGVFDSPSPAIFMGLKSLTCESYWYNFSPADYLANGVCGISETSQKTDCSWSDLAILLWLGQIYE